MTTIVCQTCHTTVVHDKRNVAGCNCDPDAPTWVCIEPNGKTFGLSAARWVTLNEKQ
jgi:hypothetical protein